MTFLLLHNPRCSKSRHAKALLEEAGVRFQVRDYQKQPLTLDELRVLKSRLARPVPEWVRWKEPAAREAGVAPDDPVMKVLEAVAEHPVLLERPILIADDRAVVGRPPERVLELVAGA